MPDSPPIAPSPINTPPRHVDDAPAFVFDINPEPPTETSTPQSNSNKPSSVESALGGAMAGVGAGLVPCTPAMAFGPWSYAGCLAVAAGIGAGYAESIHAPLENGAWAAADGLICSSAGFLVGFVTPGPSPGGVLGVFGPAATAGLFGTACAGISLSTGKSLTQEAIHTVSEWVSKKD